MNVFIPKTLFTGENVPENCKRIDNNYIIMHVKFTGKEQSNDLYIFELKSIEIKHDLYGKSVLIEPL